MKILTGLSIAIIIVSAINIGLAIAFGNWIVILGWFVAIMGYATVILLSEYGDKK